MTSILDAYYASLTPFTPPPGPTLKAHGTMGWASWPGNPQVVSIPGYTTQAGDCIIVVGASNTVGSYAQGAGAGATWVNVIGELSFQPMNSIYIGYNCPAGQTSFQVGGLTFGQIASVAFAVYSGVLATSSPIAASQTASTAGSAATSLTTPSLAYTPGQLIICGGNGFSTIANNLSTTWSNGQPDTPLDHLVTNGNEIVTISQGSSASGSSTTATQTLSPADTQRIRTILVALNHA